MSQPTTAPRYDYSPWFNQLHLSADYGSYTCDRCNQEFYHSPSQIQTSTETVYVCCCGTNQLVGAIIYQ